MNYKYTSKEQDGELTQIHSYNLVGIQVVELDYTTAGEIEMERIKTEYHSTKERKLKKKLKEDYEELVSRMNKEWNTKTKKPIEVWEKRLK
jgi:hypothetical protein